MARKKEPKTRSYMGREITKETVAFGTAGEFHRPGDFDPPPDALVTIKGKARFRSVKHTFLKGGKVQEAYVLVWDAQAFEVLDVEEMPEQMEIQDEEGAPPITAVPDLEEGE